jgi:hypothetical protein
VLERRPIGEPRLAVQRQQIAGVQRLTRALEEIDYLQQELREAGDGLGAVLTIAPLAKAYCQFQDEGGVTATDWRDWLDGKTLRGRSRHSGKHHLRLVASR